MTQQSNTHDTYDTVGIREELADTVYNIDPVETPFLSSVSHIEVTNPLFQWQTQSLAAAGANAQIEGDEATNNAAIPSVKLNNQTQIAAKVVNVSGTSRAVNSAGRGDEFDEQKLLKAHELKRDVETALLANNAKVAGDASTARETAGVPSWITSNVSKGTGAAADPTGDGTDARTDGTARQFKESQLKTVLKSCFDNGGNPDLLMVGGFNRQIVSSFTDGSTVTQRAEDSKLHRSFRVYESDFGNDLKVVPNRFQRERDALVLQKNMWSVAFLPGRNMVTEPLAKTGDSYRSQVITEFGLRSNQEAASGIVADLLTS